MYAGAYISVGNKQWSLSENLVKFTLLMEVRYVDLVFCAVHSFILSVGMQE